MQSAEVELISYFTSGFTDKLKAAGIPVSLSQTINFTKSLGVLAKEKHLEDKIYLAGKICLLSSPQHTYIYDTIYRSYLEGADLLLAQEDTPQEDTGQEDIFLLETEDADSDNSNPNADPNNAEQEMLSIRYSPTETLYEKDFTKLTTQELSEAKQIVSQMKITAPLKTSRRLKSGKFHSPHLDIKKIARLSMQTDGEPIRQAFLSPRQTNRKIVLLLDISGSMETYARVMLRFTHTCITTHRNIEAFTLSTRLTRITKELFTKDPDMALSQVTTSVKDWSGGTRLGEGLETFNNQWGIKGMARGAMVVILSDGWDKGDTQKLSEQMARLSRVANKIIWVNPLKASEGYEPLAQGMAAALPWVDDFIEGHSLFSLKNLAELIVQ